MMACGIRFRKYSQFLLLRPIIPSSFRQMGDTSLAYLVVWTERYTQRAGKVTRFRKACCYLMTPPRIFIITFWVLYNI